MVDTRWTALALRLPGTVPATDLHVIGWSRERFLVTRLTVIVQFAVLLGPGLAVLSVIVTAPLPLWVPVLGTLGGAFLGFSNTASSVTRRATAARQQMRHATVSYLRQVALLSQSGSGVVEAMTRPTTLATNSWAFGRLRAQLDLARRAGEQPLGRVAPLRRRSRRGCAVRPLRHRRRCRGGRLRSGLHPHRAGRQPHRADANRATRRSEQSLGQNELPVGGHGLGHRDLDRLPHDFPARAVGKHHRTPLKENR